MGALLLATTAVPAVAHDTGSYYGNGYNQTDNNNNYNHNNYGGNRYNNRYRNDRGYSAYNYRMRQNLNECRQHERLHQQLDAAHDQCPFQIFHPGRIWLEFEDRKIVQLLQLLPNLKSAGLPPPKRRQV